MATTSPGGGVGSVLVNAVLLWAINMWPGWRMVPFLALGMVGSVIGAVVEVVALIRSLAGLAPRTRQ
jgi:hypothetical protein